MSLHEALSPFVCRGQFPRFCNVFWIFFEPDEHGTWGG
jgi:hypothetical protein